MIGLEGSLNSHLSIFKKGNSLSFFLTEKCLFSCISAKEEARDFLFFFFVNDSREFREPDTLVVTMAHQYIDLRVVVFLKKKNQKQNHSSPGLGGEEGDDIPVIKNWTGYGWE